MRFISSCSIGFAAILALLPLQSFARPQIEYAQPDPCMNINGPVQLTPTLTFGNPRAFSRPLLSLCC